ncbi:MAG: hypothetical protein JWO00_266 [Candidatus Parcubacteria bacterium]|nr:hypothetical protein [Candidatus Parcubacteria bacterium]
MMHSWGNYMSLGPSPLFAFGFLGIIGVLLALVFIVIALVLKGYALWLASKRDEKGWFIAILIVNSGGLFELIYLIFIVKKWPKIYSGSKSASTTSHTAPASSNENNNGPKAN